MQGARTIAAGAAAPDPAPAQSDVLAKGARIHHAAAFDRHSRVAGKVSSVGPTSANPAVARRGGGRKLGLRVALTGLVVVTVAITALLIHLTWSYTAQRNVRDVAGQLNAQIIESVRHELRLTLHNACAPQHPLPSTSFQRSTHPDHRAHR